MLQRQALVQEQRLKMAPQMYQAIKLMELPVMDLRDKIAAEIENNPALEVVEDPSVVSLDASIVPQREEDAYFETSSDSGFATRQGEAASDEKQRFIEGAVARPETLQQHLLWQLALETSDADLRRIGELIIQNLDTDGFHKEPPEILLKGEPAAKIRAALGFVQALDPPGCAAENYRESLHVQASLLADVPAGIGIALDYLEELERGRFAETAQRSGLDEETLRQCFQRIRDDLSPFPGRRFDSKETRYAVPDVEVRQKEGELVIILNSEEIPVLGINPFFLKLGEKGEGEARDFARDNVKEARWFIQCINQRNHTLLRVSRAIVEFQRPFFSGGPKHLAPLTLNDIARELGVHETTVSRAANGKYMQTEWGLYEIRYFFSNSISGSGSSGSRFSKEGVKAVIKEIIETDKGRLSDQDLTGLLLRKGIKLARRTVAKYRSELDLGSSYTR
ncbi:MAG: RNA polymerase factor sigma-54 [Treponema sp.]|jgi:RNA polymerase sigma-54 factor|nr:RNA polymerase factor sigma-54 [Treponema sp.]